MICLIERDKVWEDQFLPEGSSVLTHHTFIVTLMAEASYCQCLGFCQQVAGVQFVLTQSSEH